eukprot:scaffold266862_cov35-Tisochrysis_lutea.AAC.2
MQALEMRGSWSLVVSSVRLRDTSFSSCTSDAGSASWWKDRVNSGSRRISERISCSTCRAISWRETTHSMPTARLTWTSSATCMTTFPKPEPMSTKEDSEVKSHARTQPSGRRRTKRQSRKLFNRLQMR